MCRGWIVCFRRWTCRLRTDRLTGCAWIDVFHHLPDAQRFLSEAVRCLRPGGRIVMIEPANTVFARWVYTHAHHEPFDPNVRDWVFKSSGPVSGANGALPWVVFCRDRAVFERRFPALRIGRRVVSYAAALPAQRRAVVATTAAGWLLWTDCRGGKGAAAGESVVRDVYDD